jgi:hypothetical protein
MRAWRRISWYLSANCGGTRTRVGSLGPRGGMGTVSHFRVLGCKARGNHKPFGAETDGSPAALMNCRHSSSKISLSGVTAALMIVVTSRQPPRTHQQEDHEDNWGKQPSQPPSRSCASARPRALIQMTAHHAPDVPDSLEWTTKSANVRIPPDRIQFAKRRHCAHATKNACRPRLDALKVATHDQTNPEFHDSVCVRTIQRLATVSRSTAHAHATLPAGTFCRWRRSKSGSTTA